jgi:HEAT repeat protein
MRTSIVIAFGLMLSSVAGAGRGGSTAGINAAVQSGSVDAIVAEIERAEELACLSCIGAVRPLVDHDSARVRDVAGWWLGRRGVRDEVIASMTARLTAQDPVAARNAADVLGGMREFSALPALRAFLARPLDEDSGVAAARAIGNLGAASSVPAIQSAFASPLAGVRAAAAAAVRQLRAPAAGGTISAAPLLPLFGDASAAVRREAALSSGHLQDGAAVSGLVTLLGDTDVTVRKAAAWALGQIGDKSAAGALVTVAASDSDAFVRSVANAAAGRLK